MKPYTLHTPGWQRQYDDLVLAGTAQPTRRAYARDVRYFHAWAKLALELKEHYPVAEDTVLQFILDHLGHMPPEVEATLIAHKRKARPGPLQLNTIKRMLASLSVAHSERGLISPTHLPRVKLLLRRAARANAANKPAKKAAITKPVLEKMLATCDDSLHGVRDKALLLVGFASGGRRRSELANLQVSDAQKIEGGYVLHLRKSKTDQAGKGLDVPLLGRAASAVTQWLVQSGLREGSLFRGIYPDGSLTQGISGETILRMVKRRLKQAGFDPSKYGAHSLRSGFITEAGRQGVQLKDAMSMSGHSDVRMASGYYREGALLANPAAHLSE